MAMSAAVLKAAMKAAFTAGLGAWEGAILTNLSDPNYAFNKWADFIADAVSTTVVAHIAANAKATGLDSRGDTHNLPVA